MPRLAPVVLRCAFYLYKSEEAARKGGPGGGTGFFVGINSSKPLRAFTYAVTNLHNVMSGNCFIRVNRRDGGTEVVATDEVDWFSPPEFGDLAVLDMPLRLDVWNVSFILADLFATENDVQRLGIGPGDDVFMVGRFVDHDGGQTNTPAVRFGHISIDPSRMFDKTTGRWSLSYVLDVHSRTGYSGSPVFFFRTPGSDLSGLATGQRAPLLAPPVFKLLGVHYAQFKEEWEIGRKTSPAVEADAALLDESRQVIVGLSGMTCAIPAWILRKLLDAPELKAGRAAIEERKRLAPKPVG